MGKVHECAEIACHNVISFRYKYCNYHAALHKRQWLQYVADRPVDHDKKLVADKVYNHERRDQEANAFYHSIRWTRCRDYVKQRDMMLSGLSGRLLNDHDYIVDHIIPRRLCRDPFDPNNLWLLSRSEHNRKTKYEDKLPDSLLLSLTKDDWRHKLSINRKRFSTKN
ncbi:HNH endonuclease signature motif containing protein [Limosilactobacillus antri]|uniref:HNH endonuclease signature motif containing protein n=1 Tax=Limosilactobacillus antri TaxID=227943 RepID=UPI001F5AB81F|nr:HNH endonuclease signature motif containing protein [Limosilactobacillus antri]